MLFESHKNFIKRFRNEYKKFGNIECPAFKNEKIYFNKHGFNHIIRKGKDVRSTHEQIRRIKLMSHSKFILQGAKEISEYRTNTVDGHPAFFWSIVGVVDLIKIRVIIRQLGDKGIKHFYSIMDIPTQ